MKMNINKMMQQAQQMQAKMEKAQKEIEASEFTKLYQGIEVKVNGKKEVLKLDIDEALLEDVDKEMLEDMLVVALNDVFKEVDSKSEAVLAQATGNMKIPGF
jgi:DNA-binding YbaB/EbfC family protein